MPIPFDIIAVMLFLGFYAGQPDVAPPSLWLSTLILAGFAAAQFAISFVLNRAVLAYLRKRALRYADRRQAAALAEIGARIILAGVYILALVESSFPWSLAAALGREPGETLSAQLIGVFAYFVFFVFAWIPLYHLHREVTSGRWTRWSFLLHKARYSLYMLVAWIPFAIFAEWLSEILILLPFLFLLAAWSFPYLVTKLWGCKPIPPGTISGLVKHLERQSKAHFSKVMVWEPGGGRMQNAAAVGLFPPFRYLFLTPALMENMNREELRGVILHELGHVKNRHLLFYLFTTLAGVNLAVIATELLPLQGEIESFAVLVLLVLCYFRFVFGWLSRNMERQADLFALKVSGSADGMTSALEKLGLSAGNIRREHSWHHLGIAERTTFLRRAATDPDIALRHEQKTRRIIGMGYLASILVLVGLGVLLFSEAPTPRQSPAPAAFQASAHWRRVMTLFPGNAVGPLELAYRLAGDPGKRDEAIRLAAEAVRLASGKEEREAAEKLIESLAGDPP